MLRFRPLLQCETSSQANRHPSHPTQSRASCASPCEAILSPRPVSHSRVQLRGWPVSDERLDDPSHRGHGVGDDVRHPFPFVGAENAPSHVGGDLGCVCGLCGCLSWSHAHGRAHGHGHGHGRKSASENRHTRISPDLVEQRHAQLARALLLLSLLCVPITQTNISECRTRL